MADTINIFWFRRDLRLHDNAALFHALKDGRPVLPIFIFDKNILEELEEKEDKRVQFIAEQLSVIQDDLKKLHTTLYVAYGYPKDVFKDLIKKYSVEKVFTNHDYEPYARDRDALIGDFLIKNNCRFFTYKDQVIFEKGEILKSDHSPYTVFTPYAKQWKHKLDDDYVKSYPVETYRENFYQHDPFRFPSLASMGFKATDTSFPSKNWDAQQIKNYKTNRDYPGRDATTHMSVHLRFGTISIRQLVTAAQNLSETYLNELIWRDFYQMILWHHPQVVHQSFKPEYEKIKWRNNEKEFQAWCEGKTGYPIVDAGMRQLNETGFMHNRVRMITASFLTKHLLVDWRWGEAYFAKKLLDYELASNNGGWQWAAGTGVDAAPYFRIFNPYLQTEKFDPGLKYIREWVPEFKSEKYPTPIVAHAEARERCLRVYKQALNSR